MPKAVLIVGTTMITHQCSVAKPTVQKKKPAATKKTPKLNHDTNPPGIDTYDKRKYIYDLSIDVNANYDANMDGGTNIEWEKQYYSDLPGNKLKA